MDFEKFAFVRPNLRFDFYLCNSYLICIFKKFHGAPRITSNILLVIFQANLKKKIDTTKRNN